MDRQQGRSLNGVKSGSRFWFSGRHWLAVGTALILVGCSSVPDAVNPVEWYKDVKSVVTGDNSTGNKQDAEPVNRLAADRNKPAPGVDEVVPKLSSVPPRPVITSSAERRNIQKGLVADRDGTRRYSGDVIRRQGDSSSSLPVPSPRAASPISPAVSSLPTKSEAVAPAPRPGPKAAKPKIQTGVTEPARSGSSMSKTARPNSGNRVRNFNTPQIAKVENINTSSTVSDLPQTVLISGKGVQTISSERAVGTSTSGVTTVAGVRSLDEFNPATIRRSYQVATILFGNGSNKLRKRDKRILKQVAAQHKSVGGTIRIVGHASSRTRNLDPVKHKVVNYSMSAARADAVVKELVRLGAKPSNLFVGAVSDNQPKYREVMPSGEAGNRRTDIYIDY